MNVSAEAATRRAGFSRNFWVANVLELFERFAYYSSKAILAIYLAEQVGLGAETGTWLAGSVFNTLLYLLPVLAGTVVDRFGFKRSLMICFAIFSLGYFLIGLAGLPMGQPLVSAVGTKTWTLIALIITADGRLAHQALDRRHRRAHDDRRDQVAGLLDLLHAREHRRRRRTDARDSGAREPRHLVGAGRLVAHVASRCLVATMIFFKEPDRPADAPPREVDDAGARGHGQGLPGSAVHGLPRHFLGVLGHVLAHLLCAAVLRPRRAEVRPIRDHRDGRCVHNHPGDRPRCGLREASAPDRGDDARLRPRERLVVRHGRSPDARRSP